MSSIPHNTENGNEIFDSATKFWNIGVRHEKLIKVSGTSSIL